MGAGVRLTADPAGTVATRFAGLVDLRATLLWDEPVGQPPSCLPPACSSFRHDLAPVASPCGRRLEVRGTISALTAADLGLALDGALRAVGDAAATSGAVLEARALLKAAPRAADPRLAQRLAKDLWGAGFGAGFAPCWEPAGPDALALGAAGSARDLLRFLGGHPFWAPEGPFGAGVPGPAAGRSPSLGVPATVATPGISGR